MFKAVARINSHKEDQEALVEPTKGKLHVRAMLSAGESSVLEALRAQPLHNVIIIGLILDNGLENPKNRGVCYGCFCDGSIVGVALIGHHVLLSGSPAAAAAFANVARLHHANEVNVVLGKQPLTDAFCKAFESTNTSRVHSDTNHLLLSTSYVKCDRTGSVNLRKALPTESKEIAKINSGAFMELYGINPEIEDPEGFRQRILIRLQMGRVWVVTDEKGIAFKADVVSSTPDAVYLEAIVTRPELRGSGLGTIAFQLLCARLLTDYKAVCLLADVNNTRATSFYRNVGFKEIASYRLIRYGS